MLGVRFLILLITFCVCVRENEALISGLQRVYKYVFYKQPDEVYRYSKFMATRGSCPYSFEHVMLQPNRNKCDKHELDDQVASLSTVQTGPPLMMKCLQPAHPDNITNYDNKLQVLNSLQEIADFLRPIGNATKRHEPGNCALVLFCTPTSLACVDLAPTANMIPHLFPTLSFGYIDPMKFSILNIETGLPSVPMFMIFHQGRAYIRQYDTNISPFFISHFTGVEPIMPVLNRDAYRSPLPVKLEVRPDYWLALSWLFIFISAADFLRKTTLWSRTIEVIKRNWRDAEETQMAMTD